MGAELPKQSLPSQVWDDPQPGPCSVDRFNIQNARGVGRHTPLRERGIGDQSEKEVFSFIVGEKEADDAFEFVFHEAHIDEPHGGIIYMCDVTAATPFMLPELSEED